MNLLIVDDEVQILQGLLSGIRWELLQFQEVLTAKNYSQAVEAFQNWQIDILLSDIEMTDQSGLDLIEWVNEHYPETECIILSCHDEFDLARRAVGLKCLDYVLKPIPYETLTEVLKKAMDVVRKEHSQNLLEQYGKVYMKQMSDAVKPEEMPEEVTDRAVTYIRSHIADNISVETLAKMVHVSPGHLTRLFKKQFDQTVTDYVLQQRMMLAGELLRESKLSVTMVSDKVGYGNYSYFIKLFKKFYGKTPREYQLDARNNI